MFQCFTFQPWYRGKVTGLLKLSDSIQRASVTKLPNHPARKIAVLWQQHMSMSAKALDTCCLYGTAGAVISSTLQPACDHRQATAAVRLLTPWWANFLHTPPPGSGHCVGRGRGGPGVGTSWVGDGGGADAQWRSLTRETPRNRLLWCAINDNNSSDNTHHNASNTVTHTANMSRWNTQQSWLLYHHHAAQIRLQIVGKDRKII